MTVNEFLDKFCYAPLDIFEVAEHAVKISDDRVLSDNAKALWEARVNFETSLDNVGYEFG